MHQYDEKEKPHGCNKGVSQSLWENSTLTYHKNLQVKYRETFSTCSIISSKKKTQHCSWRLTWGFLDGSSSKESACSLGAAGLIPGLGRSPGKGNTWEILAREIPWTEEPGRLQSIRSQDLDMTTHAHTTSYLMMKTSKIFH